MNDFSHYKDIISQEIRQTGEFKDSIFHVIDNSHLHKGHSGAKLGGHFELNIISKAFQDKSRIQRHQMIYQILNKYMQNGIHALNIKALTPQEAVNKELL